MSSERDRSQPCELSCDAHSHETLHSRPQHQRHHCVKLPRLHAMDDDHPSSAFNGCSTINESPRHYSLSSGSQSALAVFGPFSPLTEHTPSGTSQSNLNSSPMNVNQRTHGIKTSVSPAFPTLPEPSRRSTMMDGSLPPLARIFGKASQFPPSCFGTHKNAAHDGRTAVQSYRSPSPSMISTSPASASLSSYSQPYPAPRDLSAAAAVAIPRTTEEMGPDAYSRNIMSSRIVVSTSAETETSSRKAVKAHVSSACLNCKRAHLACDAERPCRRCTKLGKTATCVDVQHKKRGRPRLKDRDLSTASSMDPTTISTSIEMLSSWAPQMESAVVERGIPPPFYTTPTISSSGCWQGHPSASTARMSAATRQATSIPPSAITVLPAESYTHRNLSAASSKTRGSSPHLIVPSSPGAHAIGPVVRQLSLNSSQSSSPAVKLFCGTDHVVELVSQESEAIFGLYPSQLRHRSILDFVHPSDVGYLEHAWTDLVQPVGVTRTPFPSYSLDQLEHESCPLLAPARGTIFVKETVRMRVGDHAWGSCSVRIYLGGAFGLDLYVSETKRRAYIVCSVHHVDDRATGSLAASSSSHPDVFLPKSVGHSTRSRFGTFFTPEATTLQGEHLGNRRGPVTIVEKQSQAYPHHHVQEQMDAEEHEPDEEGRSHRPVPTAPSPTRSAMKLHLDIPQHSPHLTARRILPLRNKAPNLASLPPTSEFMQNPASTLAPADRLEPSSISADNSNRSSPSAIHQSPFSSFPHVSHGATFLGSVGSHKESSNWTPLEPPQAPPFASARSTVGARRGSAWRQSSVSPPSHGACPWPCAPSIGGPQQTEGSWALSC